MALNGFCKPAIDAFVQSVYISRKFKGHDTTRHKPPIVNQQNGVYYLIYSFYYV